MENSEQKGHIFIYEGEHGKPKISVKMDGETVWLTQAQLAVLFGTTKSNISIHIKNIFEEGELLREGTVKDYLTVQKEGSRAVSRRIEYYSLEMVIALGYRVKSQSGTHFRQWATARLSEYIVKGFTMDDDRLKGNGGGNYWKELLERIRDIRSSEKALYRQVLDLYATSVDYDPKSAESLKFFSIVQNKLHYATNEKTAAETIAGRADADKDFMGLTTFAGAMPTLKDVKIAKNYLSKEELFRMNRMVSAFFDLAEIKAQEEQRMTMKDWICELDRFAKNYGKGVLEDAGSVSHEDAIKKAEAEYRAYQTKTLSPVEKEYLESVKGVERKIVKKAKST